MIGVDLVSMPPPTATGSASRRVCPRTSGATCRTRRRLRRRDDDPGRRPAANWLSPAHRGGMGIRLPGGYDDQPLLWVSIDLLGAMPGIRPTARSMPGPAGACCRTIWGCSTCWGTCMSGVRISIWLTSPARVNHTMMISTYELYMMKQPSSPSGRDVRLSSGVRPLGGP